MRGQGPRHDAAAELPTGTQSGSDAAVIDLLRADASSTGAFSSFATEVEQRLRRAYIASYGVERAAEATAEALAWAWEHRDRLDTLENPVGYLYRVGQSRTRPRKRPRLPAPESIGVPEVEPALIEALADLPERQRVAVWLVHACEWTHREVAEALGVSTSAVSTHVNRGTDRLRTRLEVRADG